MKIRPLVVRVCAFTSVLSLTVGTLLAQPTIYSDTIGDIEVPVLAVSMWHDVFARSSFEAALDAQERGADFRLLAMPGSHYEIDDPENWPVTPMLDFFRETLMDGERTLDRFTWQAIGSTELESSSVWPPTGSDSEAFRLGDGTIAATAGSVGKKAVLELGGSDPFIIFADADFDAAVKTAIAARLNNSGQSCVCAKRFLVEKSIAPRFTEAFVEGMRKATWGDPLDEKHNLGPLARADLRSGLQSQLDRALAGGAKAALSGGTVDGPGFFFAPVILTDVPDDNVAAREELFGPVAPVIPFADEADALRIANGTEFGLAAAVWTADEDRAHRMEIAVEAGAVFINDMVRSDAHISFGGIKASGYGRELGKVGIHEFTNAKTVWIGK